MTKYLYKAGELKEGYTSLVSGENAELKFIEFGRLFLREESESYKGDTVGVEAVLTVFGGRCSINIEGANGHRVAYAKVGDRAGVFSGKPSMVYLPSGVEYDVVAETPDLDVGVSKASSEVDWPPVLVKPNDAMERSVGAGNWERKVYTAIGDNIGAQRLIVGETFNPPGNWSSAPPHKHDSEGVDEAPYEEVYFFRIKPSQGFGLQRIYTPLDDEDPFDLVYIVEDGDTVVIPRGYHPVVAAPGYELYYLWILAGEERRYGAWSDDPRHSWIKNASE
jgi:5-deoxy-glucuronate isomerase